VRKPRIWVGLSLITASGLAGPEGAAAPVQTPSIHRSPFVAAPETDRGTPAGWRRIAPLGAGRWLLAPASRHASQDAAPALAAPGAHPLDLADLVDPDLHPFLLAGIEGARTPRRPMLVMPTDRTRDARRRIDAAVRAANGSASLVESDSLVMRVDLDAAGLVSLVRSGRVVWAEPWHAPETDDAFVREFGGANAIETIEGFTGAGVVVEVVDKGLFTKHADLLASSPVLRTANDGPTDHGTATYGILFGNGQTQSAARGMMPGLVGLFSSYLEIDDRDAHLASLAGDYGGVIQSNSWGSGITRRYTAVSADLDESIRRHGVLVFQSQSNRGDQDSRPEAWSKNAVSVGGVNGFGTLDRADDAWGGDASTGPAIDGRIKPDLVLFNDGILTTSDLGNDQHTAFTGTSAATPAVAGHAGVMVEMWRAGVFHGGDAGAVPSPTPSTAMARALLINGAVAYPFSHAADDLGRYRQGWGTPDLLSLWGAAPRKWVADERAPLATGEGWARVFEVREGEPRLAVTLSWTEPPALPLAARTLVNDLDLRVISPSGAVYHGNHGLHDGAWSAAGGGPDATNPVENILVSAPEPGLWQVEVAARSVPVDAWDATPRIDAAFALVATGVDPASEANAALRVTGVIPDRLDPAAETVLEFDAPVVELTGAGEVRVRWEQGFGAFPIEAIGDGRFRATMSGFECRTSYEFRVQLPTADGLVTLPADPGGWFAATATLAKRVPAANESGWQTTANAGLESGAWERGAPAGGGLRLDPPFDADGDGLCWLTDNRAGESGVRGGTARLVSPPMFAARVESPAVSYDLWLASDGAGGPGEDTLLVEISSDAGQTWTTLAEERSTFRWARRVHPLGSAASRVLVRFSVSDGGDGSLVEAAIDGLAVVGAGCPRGRSDFDGSGAIDLDDVAGFVGGVLNFSTAADLNGDGLVDLGDIDLFIDDFQNNCGG
jgi:serine protease AprX